MLNTAGKVYSKPWVLYKRNVPWYLILLFSVAVLTAFLDTASTIYMMSTGLFEEANPYAWFFMDSLNYTTWSILAFGISVLLSVPLLTKPFDLLSAALFSFALVFMLAKIFTVWSNMLVYLS